MRKQSIIIRCDNPNCKEVGEVAALTDTPEGWYNVRQADERQKLTSASQFDFHSLRCVEVWAKERRAALQTLGNGNGTTGQATKEEEVWELSSLGKVVASRKAR